MTTPTPHPAAVELGLAITDPRRLARLAAIDAPSRAALPEVLDDPALAPLLPAEARWTHLYFGSEFCEHLWPSPAELDRGLAAAERLGLRFVLATPLANDALVDAIAAAAERLPADAEIVVNDWGVASILAPRRPPGSLLAGRQLAKMIKDPRLPAPAWTAVYPSGYRGDAYAAVLGGFGIDRVELDVPPFATLETFAVPGLAVSVWAPYAYVAKGRICKIGALRQPLPEKFAPGRPCRRECLGLLEAEAPPASGLRSFSRGTTMFYRHDAAMAAALGAAVANGNVSRLVLSEV